MFNMGMFGGQPPFFYGMPQQQNNPIGRVPVKIQVAFRLLDHLAEKEKPIAAGTDLGGLEVWTPAESLTIEEEQARRAALVMIKGYFRGEIETEQDREELAKIRVVSCPMCSNHPGRKSNCPVCSGKGKVNIQEEP